MKNSKMLKTLSNNFKNSMLLGRNSSAVTNDVIIQTQAAQVPSSAPVDAAADLLQPNCKVMKFKLGKRRGGRDDSAPGDVTEAVSPRKSQRFDNTAKVMKNLSKLFNCPEASDITVIVGKQRFYLHKIFLQQSDVMKIMLMDNNWSDSQKTEITLMETPDCERYMEKFFRYFYTGKVDLSSSNVVPMLMLANKYSLSDLERTCEKFAIQKVFNGTAVDRIIQWWQVADNTNCQDLYTQCRQFLSLNMDLVIKSRNFLDLTVEQLKVFLCDRNLVISSEFNLFKAVLQWLRASSEGFNKLSPQVLPLIKFSMMTSEQLCETENSIGEDEDRSIVQKNMLEAFKYHSLPFARRSSSNLVHCDVPRLYTASKTCRTFTLNESTLESAVSQTFAIPISLSQADAMNTRQWNVSFSQSSENITVLVSSLLSNREEYSAVEPSILLYKQVNGMTFVKGFMHRSCYVNSFVSETPAKLNHTVSVHIPLEALEKDSPYQVKDKHNPENSNCVFKLVMRHYHDSQKSSSVTHL